MAQLVETDLNEETSKWISGSERERLAWAGYVSFGVGAKPGGLYIVGRGFASENGEFWPEKLGIDGFQGSK